MDRDEKNYPQAATFDAPAVVLCEEKEQAGFPYLEGNCPRCGRPHHVAKEGKSACPCGCWIQFTTKPAGAPK